MAYTAEQMAAHAELHYASANRLLNQWTNTDHSPPGVAAGLLAAATAESQAGLLAMKLAEYANGNKALRMAPNESC